MTGPQLRIIRECAGISQVKLAQMLGTSQMWISRYERGVVLIPEEIAEKVALAIPKPTLEAQKVKEEEILAREQWKKKTDAYLKEHHRGRPRKEETAKEPSVAHPAEVRLCSTVELGPETLKALKDMIETAVRAMKTEAINPEVIQAAKEGAEYRRKTQAILGRGW